MPEADSAGLLRGVRWGLLLTMFVALVTYTAFNWSDVVTPAARGEVDTEGYVLLALTTMWSVWMIRVVVDTRRAAIR